MNKHEIHFINEETMEICLSLFKGKGRKEAYLTISEKDVIFLFNQLDNKLINLISLFGVENFNNVPGITLFYALEKNNSPNIVLLQHKLSRNEVGSVASWYPAAGWFEREARDNFGIEFLNAFDTRRLSLHEAYPDDFYPLLKSIPNTTLPVRNNREILPGTPYQFKRFDGEGVYEVPVGPVHAGIIEPGHFRFSVIGETVLGLEIRMFYKHRGIEKLAEGKNPMDCVTVAESISGDESMANGTAYCMAVERICGLEVPPRAWQLRTIMLELERIYSHLGDLAGMMVDIAYPVGASNFFNCREEILRLNKNISGSRFLKGILCPGGLKKDVPEEALNELSSYLAHFSYKFRKAVEFVRHSSSVVDRMETTGIIDKKLIRPLNITGPAARASGTHIDTRIDHPYGIYPLLNVPIASSENGDVLSRFDVKAKEITYSVIIIQELLRKIKDGPVCTDAVIKDGYAFTLVEAPRGQSVHWVYIKNGVIDRYKIRTASFCNWQAIEHAIIGNIVPDFPLINKSLNLSYAGTDL